MKWQEFEDGLKSRVGEHKTPLDTEALWGRLQQKKRRRRLPFWWWFGGVCLLGGLTGLLFRQDSGGAPQMAVTGSPQTETPHALSPKDDSVTGHGPVAPGLQENKADTTAAPAATIQQEGNLNARPERNASTERNAETADKSFTQTTDESNTTRNSDNRAFPIKNTGQALPDATKQIDIQAVEAPFSLLAVIPGSVRSMDQKPLILPFFPSVPAPAIPSIQPAKTRFQVGIQTGVSYWGVLQNTSADPALSRTNERLLEAFNVGVHYQKPVGQRWAFRAGIQYQRFNSVFNWQTSSMHADQNQQVLNYYSNGAIDTTYLPGALIETSRIVRHHNRNASITLPLDLKYNIPFRRGMFQPFIGVQPGFFQSAVGAILDEQGRPDYGLYPHVYQRKFGLGLRAGVSMQWRLNKHYSLLIEPSGSLDLISRKARFNPEYEQFWQVGINLGVIRDLSQ